MALAVAALITASATTASRTVNYTWCEPGQILGCFEGKKSTKLAIAMSIVHAEVKSVALHFPPE